MRPGRKAFVSLREHDSFQAGELTKINKWIDQSLRGDIAKRGNHKTQDSRAHPEIREAN